MADNKAGKGGAKAGARAARRPAQQGRAERSRREGGCRRRKPRPSTRSQPQAPMAVASAEVSMSPQDYVPRLKKHYVEVVRPQLIEQFGYKNPLEVPVIEKIVLNMGVGEAVSDTKKVTLAAADLALIAGQKPVITRARKAIATFKVRENMPIGAKVTLRKTRMYEFLDRLVTIALPRVRDFRGLNPKSFDGRGNYALGIKEHLVFPEIDYDKAESMLGMDIIVCTSAKSDDEARALLRAFNFPFRQ